MQPHDDCAPAPPTRAPDGVATTSDSAEIVASTAAGSSPPTEPAVLTVATVNAGLARGWVKHADARRPLLHDVLATENLDLLCVQEYWATDDYVALLRATAAQLPELHRAAARRPRGACEPQTLAAIEHCATAECQNGDQGLVSCVTERCKQSASGASRACAQCLVRHALAEEELAGCAEERASGDHEVLPRGGVALLSARPIAERDVLTLASPLLDRLVLHARLRDTPMGTVDVFCTHLTTPLPVDLPGMSPDINRHQVESLLAFIDAKAPPGITLVLGDLNHGPAIGESIRAHYPKHYALLTRAGFANPYAAGATAACTRCDDNPLVGGRGGGGLLIDHVLVKGHSGTSAGARFLDERTVSVGDAEVPPSDHYGVRATLRRNPR